MLATVQRARASSAGFLRRALVEGLAAGPAHIVLVAAATIGVQLSSSQTAAFSFWPQACL